MPRGRSVDASGFGRRHSSETRALMSEIRGGPGMQPKAIRALVRDLHIAGYNNRQIGKLREFKVSGQTIGKHLSKCEPLNRREQTIRQLNTFIRKHKLKPLVKVRGSKRFVRENRLMTAEELEDCLANNYLEDPAVVARRLVGRRRATPSFNIILMRLRLDLELVHFNSVRARVLRDLLLWFSTEKVNWDRNRMHYGYASEHNRALAKRVADLRGGWDEALRDLDLKPEEIKKGETTKLGTYASLEERDEAIREYAADHSKVEVRWRFGLSRSQVYRILNRKRR